MSAATPLPEATPSAGGRSYAARAPRRSILSLVPSPIKARRAPFVALLLVLLAGGLVALLLLNTASAQDAFKLHALQSQEAAVAQEIQTYTSKGDGLDDPAVLAARATALGMITGGVPQFLARGAKLPLGGIRLGDLVYIPGPVQAPVTPTPAVAAGVPAAPTAASKAAAAALARAKAAAAAKAKIAAKTPVAKTPVVKAPVAKTPVAQTPVAKTPVAKTPVAKAPVAKVPGAKTSTTGTTTAGTATGGH